MERIIAESYCRNSDSIYYCGMTEPDTNTNQSADEIPQVIESAETPAETPPAKRKCGKKKGPPFATATFRVSPPTLAIIRELAKDDKVSQGEIINRAIAEFDMGRGARP